MVSRSAFRPVFGSTISTQSFALAKGLFHLLLGVDSSSTFTAELRAIHRCQAPFLVPSSKWRIRKRRTQYSHIKRPVAQLVGHRFQPISSRKALIASFVSSIKSIPMIFRAISCSSNARRPTKQFLRLKPFTNICFYRIDYLDNVSGIFFSKIEVPFIVRRNRHDSPIFP